jgi:UDP-N-acetyl-2-amino-2-deoxyglucuronate dehydrogenase
MLLNKIYVTIHSFDNLFKRIFNMLRFAIIGCGRICKKHIEAIEALDNAKLVAVCDLDSKKANDMAVLYGLKAYTDYHQMLKNESIDVVNVLTPSGWHARDVLAIAPYKKHIVVEKPMALTLDDADAMIKACDEQGIKLFVVKQNRYNSAVVKLAQAVQAGHFGKLVLGTVRVRWCRTQAYYDQDIWRGTWAMDGGVFTNQASHHIDLLEWLMGDVESVFAKSSTRLVNIEVEDTGVALLKFRNGALGVIEATTATRPKDLEGSISILGEKGTVEIAGFAVNELKTWNFVGEEKEGVDILKQCSQNPKDIYGFGHFAYMKEVVDCISNDRKALVDGLEGKRSLELIHAIYESIETGQEVSLRFTPKKCRLGHPL